MIPPPDAAAAAARDPLMLQAMLSLVDLMLQRQVGRKWRQLLVLMLQRDPAPAAALAAAAMGWTERGLQLLTWRVQPPQLLLAMLQPSQQAAEAAAGGEG
jgi:hypothetical protein